MEKQGIDVFFLGFVQICEIIGILDFNILQNIYKKIKLNLKKKKHPPRADSVVNFQKAV